MMYRNIGNKSNYIEFQKFGNSCKIMFDKEAVIVPDYEVDDDGNAVIVGYHEDENLASWAEKTYVNEHIDIDRLRNDMYEYLNEKTNKHIINDFVWETSHGDKLNLWLSIENQINLKTAFDLISQYPQTVLPYRIKYGDDNDTKYYDIETAEEFIDLYKSVFIFINEALNDCWRKKESIDWNKYGLITPEHTEIEGIL